MLQVFDGGASAGLLQAGDRILGINGHTAGDMEHFTAQHLFRYSTVQYSTAQYSTVQYA